MTFLRGERRVGLKSLKFLLQNLDSASLELLPLVGMFAFPPQRWGGEQWPREFVLRPLAPGLAFWSQRHPDETYCKSKHSSCSNPKHSGIASFKLLQGGPSLLSVCFLFKGLSFVPAPGVTRTEDARLRPLGTVMLRPGAEALCMVRRG